MQGALVQFRVQAEIHWYQATARRGFLPSRQVPFLLAEVGSGQAPFVQDPTPVRRFHPPVFCQARAVVPCSPDLPRLGQAPGQDPRVLHHWLADPKYRTAHQRLLAWAVL